jgi:hypothetical protein
MKIAKPYYSSFLISVISCFYIFLCKCNSRSENLKIVIIFLIKNMITIKLLQTLRISIADKLLI